MKNYPTTYLILTTIFFALSLTAFIFLYKEITHNKVETLEKNNAWQAEEARRAEIRSLESTVKNIEKEKIALESHFVTTVRPVEFLNTLQSRATSVGAKADFSTIDTIKDEGGITVFLRVEGSFDSIYKYIKLLENAPYELEIQSVDISAFDKNWQAGVKLKLISFTL